MRNQFDARLEPMRALRDLIVLCEGIFGDNREQETLSRAQEGFETLRKLFGDERLAEDTAFGPMVEPSDDFRDAFQVTAGALQCMAPCLPEGERHLVRFTGEWDRYGAQTIGNILNRANAALAVRQDMDPDGFSSGGATKGASDAGA